MVKLRLKRIGRKKRPFYRIVAMPAAAARGSQALAEVGTYDPLGPQIAVDEENAIDWLNRGAQMTPTVRSIFSSQGVLARWKGHEGVVAEGAFTGDKPKRSRKLAQSKPAAEAADEAAAAEE